MLDEYAGDKNGALEVLSAAQGKHPRNYRINRQRQKVYSRSGDHALAVAEFESFANALPAANPIARVFALREAARSAAEVGELDKTRIFFEQAWEAARSCGGTMLPMKAGLSADCAIVDFQAGRIQSALTLMLRALNEAEAFDPKAGLKEHYCALILVAAILWMRGAGSDWPLERQAMMIGMCSNPDPPPEIRERPLPQSLLPWYELAELEAESSSGQVVLAALRQRTRKGGLLPMEYMLASRLVAAAVRDLDIERFVKALLIYPRAVVRSTSKSADRQLENVFAMPMGVLKPIGIGGMEGKIHTGGRDERGSCISASRGLCRSAGGSHHLA
jgi:tetratricopeptide (TPR) repeat protein